MMQLKSLDQGYFGALTVQTLTQFIGVNRVFRKETAARSSQKVLVAAS
jgi:hypothetical protein